MKSNKLINSFILQFVILSSISFSSFSQSENQIKLRYWNGSTNGKTITNPVGLEVSASNIPIANALVRVDEATLSGEQSKFYFKKKYLMKG